ncbi:MAG: 50S ribosomal protein L12 [Candidatus Falkowbacteria bacterium]|nr:50S ribosomal protein L12 [Candidatus Falkowbacteria bacterium]
MEYMYAALLLHKLGKEINTENLNKVVSSTGTDVDEAKVKVLVASLKGVDIAKELESASLMAAAPAQGEAKAEAKEEKKEEKAAEAADGLASLFG